MQRSKFFRTPRLTPHFPFPLKTSFPQKPPLKPHRTEHWFSNYSNTLQTICGKISKLCENTNRATFHYSIGFERKKLFNPETWHDIIRWKKSNTESFSIRQISSICKLFLIKIKNHIERTKSTVTVLIIIYSILL